MEVTSDTNSKALDTKTLKELKREISTLDKTEQLEILKIIKSSGNKLTENKNGIFINLSYVSDESIQEIRKFVHYSIENKSRLENLERLSEELFKTSVLKKSYDNYDKGENRDTQSQSNSNDTDNNSEDSEQIDCGGKKTMKFDEEIEIETGEIQDQEDEDNSLVLMKVGKTTCNEEDDIDDGDIGDDDDKTMEHLTSCLLKRNRFTGRKAKLVKKCKEITK